MFLFRRARVHNPQFFFATMWRERLLSLGEIGAWFFFLACCWVGIGRDGGYCQTDQSQSQQPRIIYEERQGYDSWEQARQDAQRRQQISSPTEKAAAEPVPADVAQDRALTDLPSLRMMQFLQQLAEKMLGPGYGAGVGVLKSGLSTGKNQPEEKTGGGAASDHDPGYQWQGLHRE